MEENIIHCSVGVGVIGTTSISKSESENTTRIEITKSGISKSHFIPPLIVFCEDKFAKEIISFTISQYNLNAGSYKIIECGSWMNIITSIFGCMLYAQQLKESGNHKVIEVVGVIDGDIDSNMISKVIEDTYKGDFIPSHLKDLIKSVTANITSFKLSHNKTNANFKNIKGIPEYNIKKWFEEIDEESVSKIHNEKIYQYEEFLKRLKNEENRPGIELELFFLKSQIEETLQLINLSKSIGNNKLRVYDKKTGRSIIDYHNYFYVMKRMIGNKYYHSYSMTHYTEYLILSIISKYNNKAWSEYSTPVYSLLKSAGERQHNNFNYDTFNNMKI